MCNKISTNLKALAIYDNHVPRYVALPHSTLDPSVASEAEIAIEKRSADDAIWIHGRTGNGEFMRVQLTESQIANPAFDITPTRLIGGYITEKEVFTGMDTMATRFSAFGSL